MLLRRSLWRRGLRYRANDKIVFGKPDVVFKNRKIAVFVDGDFWHGKDYPNGRNIPKENNDYWVKKNRAQHRLRSGSKPNSKKRRLDDYQNLVERLKEKSRGICPVSLQRY